MLGLLLHALVFMLIVWGMMNIKKESMEGEAIVAEEKAVVEDEPEPEPMAEPVIQEPPTVMSKVLGMDMDMADAMESGTYKTCGCSDGSRVVIMN